MTSTARPRPSATATAVAAAAAVAALAAGCTTTLSGDTVDYRSQTKKTNPLEVPPDLTQLARDSRYRPQGGGAISAAAAAAPVSGAAAPAATVAPTAVGEVRMVREGQQRWLVTPMSPEALWPQLRAFWTERGFTLDVDTPDAGVMETGWAENRAKLDQGWLRSAIGGLFDSAWDTGLRDRFRTRVERGPGGTEIYLTHRGMEEVLVNPSQSGQADKSTIWRQRPSDPGLEAEFMARLMIKLGTSEATARATVAAAVPAAAASAPRAGVATVAGTRTSLELGEGFDRAWRRVGTALDRVGFTIEDRDRTAGLYFVRYVDPATLAGEDPSFWSKLIGRDTKPSGPVRVRVQVKSDAQRSVVSVQNAQGAPETGDVAVRIVGALAAELNK